MKTVMSDRSDFPRCLPLILFPQPAEAFSTHELHLDDVTLTTSDTDDIRPVILTDNVEELIVDDLHHSPLPPTVKVIERRGR